MRHSRIVIIVAILLVLIGASLFWRWATTTAIYERLPNKTSIEKKTSPILKEKKVLRRKQQEDISGYFSPSPARTPIPDRKKINRAVVKPIKATEPLFKPLVDNVADEGEINDRERLDSNFEDTDRGEFVQGNQHKQISTQFQKIDEEGQVLDNTASGWSCARDIRTQLLWETKLSDAGVSDIDHRFSWYAPGQAEPGLRNKGHCYGIECDTFSYTQELNRIELCGSRTWRVPSFTELQTLLDRDYFNPVINQEIFFRTEPASYWTNTQLENNATMVMQIDFFNGTSSPAPIHFKLALRLVSD